MSHWHSKQSYYKHNESKLYTSTAELTLMDVEAYIYRGLSRTLDENFFNS